MNVFNIQRQIRKVGYNCGMPVWVVDFGLGVSYSPEDLLRKLASVGLQERNWLVLRNSLGERGIGTFVDALSYIHCKSEVEAFGRHQAPGWFNKADRWTVYWDDSRIFNFGALRRGQDMLLTKDLEATLAALGKEDAIDKGYITNSLTDAELSLVLERGVRVYPLEEE